jgi:hypothetical protein
LAAQIRPNRRKISTPTSTFPDLDDLVAPFETGSSGRGLQDTPCYGENCQARPKILFFIIGFFSLFSSFSFVFLSLIFGSSPLAERRSRDLA